MVGVVSESVVLIIPYDQGIQLFMSNHTPQHYNTQQLKLGAKLLFFKVVVAHGCSSRVVFFDHKVL